MEPNDAPSTGTPRWVKVFALVALAALAIVVVLLVSGRGGGHGPGRHQGAALPGGGLAGADLPAAVHTRS